jgi:hypothetical protein
VPLSSPLPQPKRAMLNAARAIMEETRIGKLLV